MRTILGLAASTSLAIAIAYYARGCRKPPSMQLVLDHWWVLLLLSVAILCVFLPRSD
jgi:hypothetical protein